MAKRAHVMQWDEGNRRRIFTVGMQAGRVAPDGEQLYYVRTGWDSGGMKTSDFLRQFGTNLALVANLKGERHYEDKTKAQYLVMLRNWKERAIRDGLTLTEIWKDDI